MNALRVSLLILLAVIASTALLTFLPFVTGADVQMVRAGLMISITRVPLALATLLFTLRAMDWMTHEPFSKALDQMRENPHAVAIYHGARIVAVCLFLASLYR